MTPPSPVTEVLETNARLRPEALAVAFPSERLTHAQLALAVRHAAALLRERGVMPGQHVGLFLPGASVEYLVLALGVMRLGSVAVCLNARFKTRELAHAIATSGFRLLLTAAPLRPVVDRCAAPGMEVVDVADVRARWTDAGPMDDDLGQADPSAAARVIYTSGTTSMPKACVHTLGAMAHQGTTVAERLHLGPDDRFWAPLPLFHTGGWTPFLAAQAAGASYHHTGHFDATTGLRQIVDDRCTVLFPGFETIWMQILRHPEFDPARFGAARLVINVGVPERLRSMQELLPNAPQISNTGCTEVGGFLCLGEASDPPESRFHTAGRLLDGMEARIVDPETGVDVPDGTPGELLVRGPACLLGYHGDPEATATALAGGWFHTGDLLRRTPVGEYVFISRLKDMLKVGGENVAAAEIEDHLLTHPAVHMVAVVAAADAHYGEVAAAFVELRPGTSATEEELAAHCRGVIASFKVPRYIRFVSEWPMAGTKIRKVELRERLACELAAGDSVRLTG
jgi:fatty-acyl-CoA synthase